MSKYHSRKVFHDGHSFDSLLERDRYIELRTLENLGVIKNLQTQVRYEIIPKQDGERAAHYVADFQYEQDGQLVVEDTKGFRTPDFVLKRKLMLWVHGIRIVEVRRDGCTKHSAKHRKKPVRVSQK